MSASMICKFYISIPACISPYDIPSLTPPTKGLRLVSNPSAHMLHDIQTAVPALAPLHLLKVIIISIYIIDDLCYIYMHEAQGAGHQNFRSLT